MNADGIALVKRWESCVLTAYLCPAGVCTIGYGHTEGVKPGQKITQHQAEVLLQYDVDIADAAVNRLAPEADENQHAALASFVFNCGEAALARSRLLRKFKAGDIPGAAAEFDRWVYGGGKVLPGLVKRRAAERELFLKPVQGTL